MEEQLATAVVVLHTADLVVYLHARTDILVCP